MTTKKTTTNDIKKVVAQVKNSELVERRHQQIVEAACKLFSEKGYHKTSLRDIASESGINLSYIYKYISTKDDILYLFYQYIMKKVAGFFETGESQNFKNPVEEMKFFIRAVFKGMESMKGEAKTMYTESRHLEKDSLRVVLSMESQSVLIIEDIIKRGIAQGYFQTKDSFMTANIITYMFPFYPLRGWNFKDRYSFDHSVDLTIDFILDALNVKEEHK